MTARNDAAARSMALLLALALIITCLPAIALTSGTTRVYIYKVPAGTSIAVYNTGGTLQNPVLSDSEKSAYDLLLGSVYKCVGSYPGYTTLTSYFQVTENINYTLNLQTGTMYYRIDSGTGTTVGTYTSISGGTDTSAKDSITGSDKNAIVLADVGALAPQGAPGTVVKITLALAVNREYLPSEQYLLRNITIAPAIPTDPAKMNTWPFEITSASYVRHLSDMTYNSRADVYYEFTIAQTASKATYPVPFKINATVWRLDPINGTNITEDVEFTVLVYLKVTEDGAESGAGSAGGALDIVAIDEDGEMIPAPSGSAGGRITLRLPLVNRGKYLTGISVSPVISASVEEFPFVSEAVNYGKSLPNMKTGETAMLEYDFRISPYATTGNKPVKFRATYRENGVYGECTFVTYINVINGYEVPPIGSAPALMVESYLLRVGGKNVNFLTAGDEAELTLNLRNNAAADTIYKIRAGVSLDTKVLMAATGSSDTAYVREIPAGETDTLTYKIVARNDAAAGPTGITVTMSYENQDVIQAVATQTLTVPVKQPLRVTIDPPTVYDSNAVAGEPIAVNLMLVNKGRTKIYNVGIDVFGDGLAMAESYYGGDVMAAAKLSADFQIRSQNSGEVKGQLVITYEDSDGEQYTQYVDLGMTVQDAAAAAMAAQKEIQSGAMAQPKKGGPSALAIIGIVLALLAAGGAAFFFLRRRRLS